MTHQETIDQAWEQRAQWNIASAPPALREAVDQTLAQLDAGRLRVAEKRDGSWIVHQWIKKAVLLSFRLQENRVQGGESDTALRFYDKVDSKFGRYDEAQFRASGIRVVPPAVARRGAYIARNVVLMPSFVNIGAYVDEGTMVDTWATVGSCAQIGKNVHLSGGVGIGVSEVSTVHTNTWLPVVNTGRNVPSCAWAMATQLGWVDLVWATVQSTGWRSPPGGSTCWPRRCWSG
jgi:2,3,4,5-tetrahydropyridine-2-carboxylate N-succinyltransferase